MHPPLLRAEPRGRDHVFWVWHLQRTGCSATNECAAVEEKAPFDFASFVMGCDCGWLLDIDMYLPSSRIVRRNSVAEVASLQGRMASRHVTWWMRSGLILTQRTRQRSGRVCFVEAGVDEEEEKMRENSTANLRRISSPSANLTSHITATASRDCLQPSTDAPWQSHRRTLAATA